MGTSITLFYIEIDYNYGAMGVKLSEKQLVYSYRILKF